MNRRDLIVMADDEAQEYIDGQATLIVATIGRNGIPHLTPNYFGRLDGLIVFCTYAKSQKVTNIERDPRVTVLVESGSGYTTLQGAMMQGRAEIRRDHEDVVRAASVISRRYPSADDEISGSLDKRVAIAFLPEHSVTWDHRKLQGLRD
jgi:nitroimidazol reductase NimA-like FMN-containing flavoprotein (pyridoxamine 5'-phosphate oxidase superfamily)